ncbi:uncharacterized protein LOC144555222 [Carex rostrata]
MPISEDWRAYLEVMNIWWLLALNPGFKCVYVLLVLLTVKRMHWLGQRKNETFKYEESSSSDAEEKISKRRRGRDKRDKRRKMKHSSDNSDEEEGTKEGKDLSEKTSNVVRKEMGLEWMLKAASKRENNPLQVEKKEEILRVKRWWRTGQSENPDEVSKKHERQDYLQDVSSRQSQIR